MALLVIDACAALHLKQLSASASGGLELLDRLSALGVTFANTSRVHGEHLSMSLSSVVSRLMTEARYRIEAVRVQERREVRKHVDRLRRKPGNNDLDLVVLARREGAVLFTHDGPAADLGDAVRVLTVDVVDLGALLVARGAAGWGEVEAWLGGLDGFAWKPDDWAGGVEATWRSRRGGARLRDRLEEWLDA